MVPTRTIPNAFMVAILQAAIQSISPNRVVRRRKDAEVTLAHWTDAHEIDRFAGDLSWEGRPLALGDGFALIGFREDEWRKALGV